MLTGFDFRLSSFSFLPGFDLRRSSLRSPFAQFIIPVRVILACTDVPDIEGGGTGIFLDGTIFNLAILIRSVVNVNRVIAANYWVSITGAVSEGYSIFAELITGNGFYIGRIDTPVKDSVISGFIAGADLGIAISTVLDIIGDEVVVNIIIVEVVNINKVPIVIRGDVVIRPEYAGIKREEGIRRKRRPADKRVIKSPFYPGRSPLVVREPDPAIVVVIEPAAVVEDNKAKRFIRIPIPAKVSPDPST